MVKKLWPRLSFFQKYVKSQGQGHEVKNFGIDRKVLSQGIHLCNIKALPPFVKKVMVKVKFTLDRQTDRQTDGQTDRQDDSYIPPNFVCGGIKRSSTMCQGKDIVSCVASRTQQERVDRCMSRLTSFVFADSSCEPREESENYKMKNS